MKPLAYLTGSIYFLLAKSLEMFVTFYNTPRLSAGGTRAGSVPCQGDIRRGGNVGGQLSKRYFYCSFLLLGSFQGSGWAGWSENPLPHPPRPFIFCSYHFPYWDSAVTFQRCVCESVYHHFSTTDLLGFYQQYRRRPATKYWFLTRGPQSRFVCSKSPKFMQSPFLCARGHPHWERNHCCPPSCADCVSWRRIKLCFSPLLNKEWDCG